MSRKSTLLIILLVVLLLGAALYEFYRTHDYKNKTIHTGLLGEARKNPLYASRLFLKRMGIPTETHTSQEVQDWLPDTQTVILMDTRRSSFSTLRTEQLLDWVSEGGHLIARSTSDWNYSGNEKEAPLKGKNTEKLSSDPLQRALGVRSGARFNWEKILDELKLEAKSEEKKDNNKSNQNTNVNDAADNEVDDEADDTDKKKYLEIKLPSANKSLLINTGDFHPLILDRSRRAISQQIKVGNRNFIIRQKVGNGLVTLVANLEFIQNYPLEKADHAEILWYLVHGVPALFNRPAPETVWLVHSDKAASLWDLIWEHYWAFLVSLGLLLVGWMMMVSRRFGPLIPKQQEDRRRLNEHITSSGNYYWKHKQKDILINSAREALMQRLGQVFPGWSQRSKEEQIQLLAKHLEITPEAIQKLLFSSGHQHPDEFTALIRQLENIRKSV